MKSKGAYQVLVVTTVVCLLSLCDGAKIVLVPANINSHISYFGRLATSLAELGHSTHMLVTSNAHVSADLLAAASATDADAATKAAYAAKNDTSETSQGDVTASSAGSFTLERYAVDGNEPFSSSPEMTEV
jgi:hypothetical protein